MSTRTQMVARLRQELGDETAPYTWSDDYLHNLIVEAAEALGQEFPVRDLLRKDVASNQREFAITLGTRVREAECPPGKLIPQDPIAASADPSAYEPRYRQSWTQVDDALYVRYKAAGDEVGEQKLVLHVDLAWPRPDPEMQWSGTAADELLLIAASAVQAWSFLEGRRNKLGRVASTKPREAAEARLAELKRQRRRRFHSRSLEEQG